MALHPEAAALLARSHRLGSDPRNTNYAGGNASAKGAAPDPVTGDDVELMWVKGSGGDLGTLTEEGLAVLRLDRLRALRTVYAGEAREDEMVAAFDYCLHGKGGAAPSIDTAMHGLVDAPHVDHLHPDSGIALACAADGEKLTADCFGGTVAWVPWRRPGFQLGLDIAAVKDANPGAIGCVLGGHGITAWGETSEECEANALHIIRTAGTFLAERGRPEPFGPVLDGYEALPRAERRARAAALAPYIRALASEDRTQVGHFDDSDAVLDFLARTEHPRLAALPLVQELTGLPGPVPVTTVGSHDTASAVAAVPAARAERFAYLCTGTWSLAGLELDAPVTTEASRAANFTNELGIDGTVRFLRNIMGMWLLQECMRTWGREDVTSLLAEAARAPALRSVVDAAAPEFLAPGDMPERIAAACRATGQPVPATPGATTRCILDSLALAHRRAIHQAQRLADRAVDVVHIVGGGARNALLCQLTADACGLPVVAGPAEAAALGNVLVQARAHGLPGDLAAGRELIARTQPLTRYEPSGDPAVWEAAARRTEGTRRLHA
ncbi:FGGY-family carbohydrate kinase [Streptomyces griseus]